MHRTTRNEAQAPREPRARGLEGSELVYVLFKRKGLVGAAVLVALAVAVLPGLVTPPLWEASTVLLMRRGAAEGGAAGAAVLPEPEYLARPAVLAQLVERLGPAAVQRASLAGATPAPSTAPASPVTGPARIEPRDVDAWGVL